MDIEYRKSGSKWIVEVWCTDGSEQLVLEPYPEVIYTEINQWCIDALKYHARTAYHIFELKTKKDLEWFLLRWT